MEQKRESRINTDLHKNYFLEPWCDPVCGKRILFSINDAGTTRYPYAENKPQFIFDIIKLIQNKK